MPSMKNKKIKAKKTSSTKNKALAKNKKSAKASAKKSQKIKIRKLTGQKKMFYDILMNMRAKLTGQVQILSEEALTTGTEKGEHSSSMANHLADYGSDNFMHNMELDIMTGEMEDIEMIDEAIERLLNGEYGKCLECGCKIPLERLKAKPHARYCVKCKALHEAEAQKIELQR